MMLHFPLWCICIVVLIHCNWLYPKLDSALRLRDIQKRCIWWWNKQKCVSVTLPRLILGDHTYMTWMTCWTFVDLVSQLEQETKTVVQDVKLEFVFVWLAKGNFFLYFYLFLPTNKNVCNLFRVFNLKKNLGLTDRDEQCQSHSAS